MQIALLFDLLIMDKVVKKIIIRRSEEEKLALIEKWESSDLPITVFCGQHNFSDFLFHSWLNKMIVMSSQI